jgi:lipopolysaccharide/colanic/teichoic acid biosynthesis glycosyltransferase
MLRSETYRSERRRVQAPTSCLQSLSKRGFDLIVATAGLLLLSPLIIFVSLGIRFAFSKPILCQQKRYNSNNVEFELFEFRIRHVDQQEQRLNRRLDQIRCCTSIGRFLCRSGLSKLPQLLNVLRGEISIVGSHLFTDPPGITFPPVDLGKVKPGLVSWADVNDDAHDITDKSKIISRCIKCDRYYIDNWSLSFDITLLVHTFLSKKILLEPVDKY